MSSTTSPPPVWSSSSTMVIPSVNQAVTSRLTSPCVTEALSALLRTVWSVLDRTPPEILHEVVLVDDGSNHTDIVDTLPLYIKHRLPPKVRLVR